MAGGAKLSGWPSAIFHRVINSCFSATFQRTKPMTKQVLALAGGIATALWMAGHGAMGQSNSHVLSAVQQAWDLTSGWSLLREGEAEGSIEPEAARPAEPGAKYLHITVTKTAPPGRGRVGAINSTPIKVDEGKWYDVTLQAIADGRSVGMVFSLESADGKVLARTTLPEIGRVRSGGGGNDTQSNPLPRKYTLALHARASSVHAQVTLTPIEPTSIWIENLTITPRASAL